jgi:hypothetical protein
MSITVLNTDAGLSGKTIDTLEGDQTITGAKTFDRDPNPPFAVSSGSAVVPNLDADKLDGQEGSYYLDPANLSGSWTTPTFSAGNFTGNGSMTWTVAAGDVSTYAYKILGKTMIVAFSLITTTVGGTPSTTLQIAIPASKVATKRMANPVLLLDNNVRATGYAEVAASGTVIQIIRTDAANFTASADQTYVFGQITFEIN